MTEAQAPDLPRHLRKLRLRRREVAEYLDVAHGIQIAPATLSKWASTGDGPTFYRLNRSALYSRTDIDSWVASKLKRATSGDER
ncbi:MAG: hypothetical protein KIS73_05105 [Enhydrobacter sp.]|nr:hypothetical protein [Enhydrobacter sp.]